MGKLVQIYIIDKIADKIVEIIDQIEVNDMSDLSEEIASYAEGRNKHLPKGHMLEMCTTRSRRYDHNWTPPKPRRRRRKIRFK